MDFVHKDNKLTGFIFRETSHFQKFCVIYPQEHHMNVYEGLLLREAFLRKEVIELRFSKEIEKVTQWSIICLPV